MISLYGLTIQLVDSPTSLADEADIVWERRRVSAFELEGPARGWSRHDFGPGREVHFRFEVSADGRSVRSEALPWVHAEDLFTTFAEAVMRSIFRRRGIVSFHAAALARGERAILLMGDKGAGKSTLSAALALRGWSVVSDDLVRLIEGEPGWCVLPGSRDIKLRADAVAALALDRAVLGKRWESAGAHAAPPEDNKFILRQPDLVGEEPTPLAAIYVLGPRHVGLATEPLVERLAPADRLNALLRNLSEAVCCVMDWAPLDAAPTVLSLLASTPISRVHMSEGLDDQNLDAICNVFAAGH
jgi:hypothetical protein